MVKTTRLEKIRYFGSVEIDFREWCCGSIPTEMAYCFPYRGSSIGLKYWDELGDNTRSNEAHVDLGGYA